MPQDSDNGADKPVEAQPAAGPVVLAQLAVTPDGQLSLMMSNQITDPVAFLVAAINLLSGVAAEHIKKRQQVSKIIQAPAGMRVPRVKQ